MAMIHAGIGVLLLLSHAVFLFRGLALRRSGDRPGPVDRIARAGSHIGLPLVIATGFLARLAASRGTGTTFPGPLSAIHTALGILPLVLIVAFAPLRPLRKRIPWLLPAANLVLFAGAAATGLILVR
jgi:hypothetical protein